MYVLHTHETNRMHVCINPNKPILIDRNNRMFVCVCVNFENPNRWRMQTTLSLCLCMISTLL